MSKLKKGDRVVVYDASEWGLHRTDGIIEKVCMNGTLIFKPDLELAAVDKWYVHPKQCKLVKGKKNE